MTTVPVAPQRLADFLETSMDVVLAEWVTFARTLLGAADMNLTALRDHAAEMLTDIIADLRTPQTAEDQRRKSQGEEVHAPISTSASAKAHGAARADSGFTMVEMIAEFRALRASVLRLWTAEQDILTRVHIDDLARFHEAIDEIIAESVGRFHTSTTQSQDLFVAVLGHDLRTPLHTVSIVTEAVADANVLDAHYAPLMARAVRSTKRMTQMLDDLLDFTRSRMGGGLPVNPHDVDLHRVVEDAVDEFRSSSPQHTYAVAMTGDLRGSFDAPRIGQVLSNLLGNAVQHGDPTTPVQVVVRGDDAEVIVEVRNSGPTIPAAELPTLFGPFKRLRHGNADDAVPHLGLGLYIADEIVTRHGGRLVVTSTDDLGTCFAAHLPRHHTDTVP